MNSKDIITLGLDLQAPWKITGQLLDTDKNPHELRLTIQTQRVTRYLILPVLERHSVKRVYS